MFNHYNKFFKNRKWAQLPKGDISERTSSYHLYPLRLYKISETQRDAIIQKVADAGIAVNVHFIPMPMLTLFKTLNYRIAEYPVTYDNFSREISLPIYPQNINLHTCALRAGLVTMQR